MSGGRSLPSDGAVPGTAPPPCSLAIRRAGVVVEVAIHGELDASTVQGLDHVLRDLICDQGNLHVAVDVGAVSDADTTGVAALVDACRLAREHHATLAVVNMAPAIEQAFDWWLDDGVMTDDGMGACCSGSIPGTGDRQPRFSEGRGGFDAGLPASARGAQLHRPASPDDHVVEFYFREEHLAESVRDFLLPALDCGESALVVATDDHRRRCDEELRVAGIDVDDCRRQGRYVSLDAGETLASFMVGEMPDRARFETAMGELVRRMAAGWGGLRIFGEMVAVLWADGNVGAAGALEELWNSLRAKESFELLCAYPTSLFERDEATELFRRICDQHTRVVPSERIAVERGALRAIALLEQRVDAASAAGHALEGNNHESGEDMARIEDLERRRDDLLGMVAQAFHHADPGRLGLPDDPRG